ncbi:hypothetical protein NEFER03_1969 [Nematocida sp. LUAm3]|nr:hypothetical protein NEFER03_1969 [Nematocida sp. LUAm3]KAI5176053.1 hypothetical protein NEFER02_1887 [Nematocida sp. LUAm2]KAI5177097.1 hypothetical protein NEFER01_0372 [Nematocida sp. LUAm1]
MYLEKGASLEERLQSYKQWKTDIQPKETFAYAGFIKDVPSTRSDALSCAFCLKSLEGWDSEEVPVEEHQKHSSNCVLFNTHRFRDREFLATATKSLLSYDIRKALCKNGLALYCLEKNTLDFFCYYCGFLLSIKKSQESIDMPTVLSIHTKFHPTCQKSRETIKKSTKTHEATKKYFFYRLLSEKISIENHPRHWINEKTLDVNICDKRSFSFLKHSSSAIRAEESKVLKRPRGPRKKMSTEDSQTFSSFEDSQESSLPSSLTSSLTNSLKSISESENVQNIEKNSVEEHRAPKKSFRDVPQIMLTPLSPSKSAFPQETIGDTIRVLNSFINEEERSSLNIKSALNLALQRLLAQVRDATEREMEGIRAEISISLAEHKK